MTMKNILCAAAGGIGGFITYLAGGWTNDLQTLFLFMVIDFFTGLLVAAVFKKSNKTESGAANSKACLRGLCKKIMMLIFVCIAYRLDVVMNVGFIRSGVIIGFLVNELISIIENAGLMGITVPVIEEAIDILKKKVEKENEH